MTQINFSFKVDCQLEVDEKELKQWLIDNDYSADEMI